jgi:hypothetical protein
MSTRSILGASRRSGLCALVALAAAGGADPARAEEAAAADGGGLTLELNKVEETADGCQTYFLLDNQSGHVFDGFRLDLILFDGRGVIGDRLRLDLAPVRSDKRTVWTYVFPDTACTEIGSILVNDIPVCEARGGAAVDCVDLLRVGGRDSIPLEK